jgi:hypothetical protein
MRCIDGAWNWWMDKNGNVEYARMKEDAYDHFFPSPEHLNLQNSTWEVQSLAGYFKEVIDTKEQRPDDIFTLIFEELRDLGESCEIRVVAAEPKRQVNKF